MSDFQIFNYLRKTYQKTLLIFNKSKVICELAFLGPLYLIFRSAMQTCLFTRLQ